MILKKDNKIKQQQILPTNHFENLKLYTESWRVINQHILSDWIAADAILSTLNQFPLSPLLLQHYATSNPAVFGL